MFICVLIIKLISVYKEKYSNSEKKQSGLFGVTTVSPEAESLRKPLPAPSFLHGAEHLLCVSLYVQLLFCLILYYEISHIIKSFWLKKEFQWLDILCYGTYLNHFNLFLIIKLFSDLLKPLKTNLEYPFMAICSVFKISYI